MHPKCTFFVTASFIIVATASSCRVYHTTATPPAQEQRVVVVKEQPKVIVVKQQPQVVVVKDEAAEAELARLREKEKLEKERV